VRVAIRTIPQADGERVLSRWLSDRSGVLADRDDLALAVRFSLQLLREKAPGRSVEVRVPPYGAAQVVEGPTHTRGTPPAVVEAEPETWLEVIIGQKSFAEAVGEGTIQLSGLRTDLQGFLPLWPLS
jgi:hypothetical protein